MREKSGTRECREYMWDEREERDARVSEYMLYVICGMRARASKQKRCRKDAYQGVVLLDMHTHMLYRDMYRYMRQKRCLSRCSAPRYAYTHM